MPFEVFSGAPLNEDTFLLIVYLKLTHSLVGFACTFQRWHKFTQQTNWHIICAPKYNNNFFSSWKQKEKKCLHYNFIHFRRKIIMLHTFRYSTRMYIQFFFRGQLMVSVTVDLNELWWGQFYEIRKDYEKKLTEVWNLKIVWFIGQGVNDQNIILNLSRSTLEIILKNKLSNF